MFAGVSANAAAAGGWAGLGAFGTDNKGEFGLNHFSEVMSRRIRKPTICIWENKGAEQLRSNCWFSYAKALMIMFK